MKITMDEIAKIAGVSKSTVSKICHNSPEISIETAERVRKIMQENNYVFRKYQGKYTNNRHTIGLIIEHPSSYIFTNPFLCEVLVGICETLSERNYTVSFFWEGKGDYGEIYRNYRLDGIILLMPLYYDTRVTKLIEEHCPLVSIGEQYLKDKIRYIDSDDEKGIKTCVEFLYGQGHRKFAFLGGNPQLCSGIYREKSFRETLTGLGIPINEQWIKQSKLNTQEDGKRLMNEILGASDFPSAIVCFNDQIAIGAFQSIRQQGFNVPDDFSITGFDDTQICKLIEPNLTTVTNIAYEKGIQAANWLCDIIEMGDNNVLKSPIKLPVNLVVRDSTKIL